MRVRVAADADRDRFNAFVAASPLADVLQAYEWGEIKRRSGWDALRLLAEDDRGVRAACSVLRTRPARGVPPLLYAPRGPVLDFSDGEALAALVGAVRERAGGAFFLKCDPPIETDSPGVDALERAGFRPVVGSGFGGVQPKAVMVLDLEPDLDKIFEGFKAKWRYNVRVAERRGVTVREGTRADLPPFYDLLLETARRDGFLVRGRTYFEALWDVLAPAGMLQTFVADLAGETIAGIMLFTLGERTTYTYGASSSRHRNVMPNHLLQWHAIRWAKERGLRIYDFRGVSPVRDGRPTEPHIAGLNRFKEGFGARYVEYAGELDLPLRAGWYGLWRVAAPPAMKLRRALARGPAATAD
jgi:lipid II:glycine glycyltransferase (peptidoglycan interpeptide bridge formation enzyme)